MGGTKYSSYEGGFACKGVLQKVIEKHYPNLNELEMYYFIFNGKYANVSFVKCILRFVLS